MLNNNFSKQVIIITGASLGIGAATALELSQKGATVILNGRNEGRLQAIKSSIDEKGGKSFIVSGDITQESTINQLVSSTLSRLPT